MFIFKLKNNIGFKKGMTLLETVLYLALLSILIVLIFSIILSIISTHKQIQAGRRVEESAVASLERMTYEIRNAKNINGSSSLGSHPGILVLDSTDSAGADKTVRFYVQNGAVKMDENNTLVGPLTTANATTTNLVFRSFNTGNSQAVKIEMTIESSSDSYTKSMKFYSTAVLRGSY